MSVACVRAAPSDRAPSASFPTGYDEASRLDELAVPELKVAGARAVGLDALEQVVALDDDALVALDGAQVLAVDLGDEDVHIPAAQAGRAVHHVEVLRGEHDGVDLPDQLGRAAGYAVDADVLLDVQTVLGVASGRLVDGVLQVDLDTDGAVLALDYSSNLGEELYADGLAADEFTLGRGALGLGDDEEVEGFEEVALAVPVVALHEHHSWLQIDLQPLVVAYVEERKLGEMDGETSEAGDQDSPDRDATRSRKPSSVMTVTPSFSASASFDPASSPATR